VRSPPCFLNCLRFHHQLHLLKGKRGMRKRGGIGAPSWLFRVYLFPLTPSQEDLVSLPGKGRRRKISKGGREGKLHTPAICFYLVLSVCMLLLSKEKPSGAVAELKIFRNCIRTNLSHLETPSLGRKGGKGEEKGKKEVSGSETLVQPHFSLTTRLHLYVPL